LASFTNYSGGAAGASAALTKALLGERESVKSLGISILEEDVKKQMAIQSAEGLAFATERQAKAYATLTIAQNQSKNAIGDYARTSEQFANVMRRTKGRLTDLAVAFGKILLPMATKVLKKIEKLIKIFGGLTESQKTVILWMGALAAAIGPVLLGAGLLLKAVLLAKAGFLGLNASMLVSVLAALAIAAAIVLIGLAVDDLVKYLRGFEDTQFGKFVEWLERVDRLLFKEGEFSQPKQYQALIDAGIQKGVGSPDIPYIAPRGPKNSNVTNTVTITAPVGADAEEYATIMKDELQSMMDGEKTDAYASTSNDGGT